MNDAPRTYAKRFEIITDLQSGLRYVVDAGFAAQLELEAERWQNVANALATAASFAARCEELDEALMFYRAVKSTQPPQTSPASSPPVEPA